jgi:K+-sensing histidine kinase KdpD
MKLIKSHATYVLLLTVGLLFTIISFGQKKDTTVRNSQTANKDTILTANTKLLSISDIERITNSMKDKISARQYEYFMLTMNHIISVATKEWEQQHKTKKP